jgi:predicted ribosome quality control (RQC) complex YloA/Tae2 family protein
MPAIIGVSSAIIVLAGAVIYKLNTEAKADKARVELAAQGEAARIKREAEVELKRFQAKISQMEREAGEAKTQAEKDRIRSEIVQAKTQRERERSRPREVRRQDPAPKPAGPSIKQKIRPGDDPLEGLKL